MKNKYDISDDGVLKFITPYVVNKTILDIGCVEHNIDNIHKERIWVHDYLVSVAKNVIGLDYLSTAVKALNRLGYKILCQNAEDIKIDSKFDVVFAGELIEHLSNQGLFLNSVKKVLKPNGRLIITTPNAFSLQRLIPVITRLTNNPNINQEHVLFHTPKTLETLLTRNGFSVETVGYAHYPVKQKNLKQKVVRLLCPIIGHQFMENLMFIAKLNPSNI